MEKIKYTQRQQRELEYYDEFAAINKTEKISFDPIFSKARRPWNSYWYVYDLASNIYKKGSKLLEIGCGQGVASVRLAKIGYSVHGFDISEKNIQSTKLLSKKYGLEAKVFPSIQIAESLNYPSDEFDVIVGFDILHHIDIMPAIKECYRVLKKGGVAIFREHTEAYALEKIRNSGAITKFFSKEISFENHITHDERKLNDQDLSLIEKIFPDLYLRRFVLLSRFDQFFRKKGDPNPSSLEVIDSFIFSRFSFTRRFAGGAVIVMKKT